MLTWNINGLCRKLTDCDFLSYVNDYDILLLQETWINSKININLNLNGYFCHHVLVLNLQVQKKAALVAAFRYMQNTN